MSKYTLKQPYLLLEMAPFGQTLFPTTTTAHRVLPSVWGLGQEMVTTVSAVLF